MSICEDYLADIEDAYDASEYYMDWLEPRLDYFDDHYAENCHKEWRKQIRFAFRNVFKAIKALTWGTQYYLPPYRIPYYLGHCIEAPPLTMRAILDEMFTASNEELMQFIALVDAYRQSLWNKPFDANYWAAVARGFEQWEF